MPSRLDQLKNPVKVWHRASNRIAKAHAKICVDDKFSQINIQFEDKPETLSILILDIEFIKTKDFNDSQTGSMIFILSVNRKDGTHTSFQFEDKETRDAWDNGLRSLHSGVAQSTKSDVKVPSSQFLPIKSIALQKPSPGQVVNIKVDIGKEDVKRSADLVVLENQTGKEQCTQIAVDFVEQQSILPTETTSLYRYIRSVVQRAQMEKEVIAIVEEVNNQSFEKIVAEKGNSDHAAIVEAAKARLTTIYNQIPLRIGQQGSGATIVTQVLKRNIEKMKLINEMAAKLAAEGGKGSGS